MVIFEGTISHRVFGDQVDQEHMKSYKDIVVGLGKICAGAMFVYFFLKILIFVHGRHWSLLNTPMGYWYLTEVLGLVLLPCFLFLQGVRNGNLAVIRVAAVLTMAGIIINRLNISVIAFKWYARSDYFPALERS